MCGASLLFMAVDTVGPLLYALRVVQGAAFAMAFTAGAALAVDEAPPERVGQAIGIFGLAFLSMNAVAPATIEEIAARAGWPAAFAVAGGAAALSCLLSLRLRDRRPGAAAAQAVPGLRQMLVRPSLLRILLVVALASAAMGAAFTFHQLYALELGMRNVRAFFVAYTAAAIAVRVGLGHVADRAGRRRVSLLALFLYVAVVTGMPGLGAVGLVPFGLGLGVAHGLFYPAFNAVAVESVGERERGKVMALFQSAFNVGFAGGALALGVLAEHSGFVSVFLAGGACAAAALALLAVSPEGRAPQPRISEVESEA